MKPITPVLATLIFSVSCGKANRESALEASHQGASREASSRGPSSISGSCLANIQKGNSLITEKASFKVTESQQFKLVYSFTIETQGEKRQGSQEITGVLDKDFKSAFEPKKMYFLLSKGEFKSQFGGKLTERHLDKTEILLKDGRLLVEEHDIVLDLKNCEGS